MLQKFVRVLLSVALLSLALPANAAQASDSPRILAAIPVQVLLDQQNRFVAGKETIVLVVVESPVIPGVAQRVVVKRDGATVTTLAPLGPAEPRTALEFVCPSMADCGGWAAGSYTFEVTVGSSTATSNTFVFQTRAALHVLAVPVRANYGPGDVRTVDDSWKGMGEYTRRVFPVAPANFKWHIGSEIDLSADKYDLRTNEGMFEVWQALAMLQPTECQQSPRPAGLTCYDKVVGFVKDRQGADGNIQGYTMGKPANVVTATDEDAQATVAHEVAHPFEIGDEYQGGSFHCAVNPTPPEYVGKDWHDRGNKNFSCTASTRKAFPFGGTGTLIPAGHAYEIGGRRALPPMVSFMGSGAKQNQNWISTDVWVRLFDKFDPAAKASVSQAAATTRAVAYFGDIDGAGKVRVEPWFSFNATSAPSTTGNLHVRALDASGRTLATSAIAFDDTIAEPIPNYDHSAFQGVIAYPTGTARFEIVRGATVLASVPVSKNAPAVAVTSPKAGDRPTGDVKVTWTASDADGDKLTTQVEYSPDNGKTWYEVAPEVSGTELVIDAADLPGTGKAEALFRVTSTDGINTTAATSGAFTVTAKAPLADIYFPSSVGENQAGNPVFLYGEGYDLLDDIISSDAGLAWTSDRDGALGKGSLIETSRLSVGVHRITLTVTNSLGLKGTATVTVVVHPAGRKVAVPDVYAVYNLFLGRNPVFPNEVLGHVGKDLGAFVDEVADSLEHYLLLDVGYVIENKSPYTGQRVH